MLKLRRPPPINRHTRPIIRPRLVPRTPQRDHRLNRKTHPHLGLPDGLVLRIMRHIRRRVEELVNTMAHICLHHLAVLRLGVFFDRVAVIAEQRPGFHERDGFVETAARGLDDAHAVGVLGGAADVVGFVQVAVEAAVVEGDVDVEDVAIDEDAVVRDAVADDFVERGADGFGEVTVI